MTKNKWTELHEKLSHQLEIFEVDKLEFNITSFEVNPGDNGKDYYDVSKATIQVYASDTMEEIVDRFIDNEKVRTYKTEKGFKNAYEKAIKKLDVSKFTTEFIVR